MINHLDYVHVYTRKSHCKTHKLFRNLIEYTATPFHSDGQQGVPLVGQTESIIVTLRAMQRKCTTHPFRIKLPYMSHCK